LGLKDFCINTELTKRTPVVQPWISSYNQRSSRILNRSPHSNAATITHCSLSMACTRYSWWCRRYSHHQNLKEQGKYGTFNSTNTNN